MKAKATRPASKQLIALDLFAGAGGLAEGLEQAGIKIAAAVELHPQAALTHAFNHPETTVFYGDIRKLQMERVAAAIKKTHGQSRLDLVVGGPPCQGFSTAGKKFADDPRNSLFESFVHYVEHFRPRMFLLENVPGFKKMHGGDAYNRATEMFSALGYKLTDRIVDAVEYGLPQQRRRFVMVGWLPGETAFAWPAAAHAAEASSRSLSLFASSAVPPVTVLEAIGDLDFLEPGWEANRHMSTASTEYQRERRSGGTALFNHLASRHRERAVTIFKNISEGKTIASVPAEIRSAKRTMARLDRHDISNAILALPDDLIHYHHHRSPTVREMARLQGFDDDFVFFGKRTTGFMERRVDVPQYTQVGNAVPPLMALALGRSLVHALGAKTKDVRNLKERRARHRWIRGSSGYAGYTLDPKASGEIRLFDVEGRAAELPISKDLPKLSTLGPLTEWKALGRSPSKRRSNQEA